MFVFCLHVLCCAERVIYHVLYHIVYIICLRESRHSPGSGHLFDVHQNAARCAKRGNANVEFPARTDRLRQQTRMLNTRVAYSVSEEQEIKKEPDSK